MGRKDSYTKAVETLEDLLCGGFCEHEVCNKDGCQAQDALNKLYSLIDTYQTIKEAVKE